jgi:hypothetical protein
MRSASFGKDVGTRDDGDGEEISLMPKNRDTYGMTMDGKKKSREYSDTPSAPASTSFPSFKPAFTDQVNRAEGSPEPKGGQSPLWTRMRDTARKIASSVANSVRSMSPLASPRRTRVSPAASPWASRNGSPHSRGSLTGSRQHSPTRSHDDSDYDVDSDEEVIHWRAVAQEELADRLEVLRQLRQDERALQVALDQEATSLQEVPLCPCR